MIQSMQAGGDNFVFRLGRAAYVRIRLIGWLLIGGSLVCTLICALLSARLLPSYEHTFTLYLKWQDALVASLWYIGLLLLGGCVLVVRFLFALRAGYRDGMLMLKGDSFTGRDLSAKNLSSIYWAVNTALWCFVAALVGLVPLILIGWTVNLPNLALVVLGTGVALLLSLAGLVVTAIALSFIVIGWIGCVSFCRRMGSSQTYRLTSQATLRIDGFVLSIMYPDQQESLFDLNLVEVEDQRTLLHLLRERWLAAQPPWNPDLGEEIEAALEEAERQIVMTV